MSNIPVSKVIVRHAVHKNNPPRVPLFYTNCNQELSDLTFLHYAPAKSFVETTPGLSEWGFVWGTLNETIGQAHDRPFQSSWEAFESYVPPDPNLPERYAHWQDFIESNKNLYIIGNLGITGFNLATFLRGFENFLEDLYLEPERADRLLEMVFGYETGIINNMLKYDIDAISFFDDWGTQKALMIHPDLWRKVFKPLYKKQFDIIHEHGKDVFFHCCGQIQEIIGDLIEIGADILNLNQPDLFGIETLGKQYGGKVCFCCPVDHQTTALAGTREEIFDYVERLYKALGTHNGGFIGNIEEYHICGMTQERYKWICEAFESLNKK